MSPPSRHYRHGEAALRNAARDGHAACMSLLLNVSRRDTHRDTLAERCALRDARRESAAERERKGERERDRRREAAPSLHLPNPATAPYGRWAPT